MRGGVSLARVPAVFKNQSSPHAWGCFQDGHRKALLAKVFPTCVGVFLNRLANIPVFSSLPHMRGGVSKRPLVQRRAAWSSPHAWGCFYLCPAHCPHHRVFPTCVGVFLKDSISGMIEEGLPHMRGGVSCLKFVIYVKSWSSPHAWGCFHRQALPFPPILVFPTCVGVFLCH